MAAAEAAAEVCGPEMVAVVVAMEEEEEEEEVVIPTIVGCKGMGTRTPALG